MTRTAREIYTEAEQGARREHARMVRQFIAGKLDVCPCGMDMERDAVIEAFAQIIEKGQCGDVKNLAVRTIAQEFEHWNKAVPTDINPEFAAASMLRAFEKAGLQIIEKGQ